MAQHQPPPPQQLQPQSSQPHLHQQLVHNSQQNMSLYELRELATRQQQHIQQTHQLIVNREQKLKFLRHDQTITAAINECDTNLLRLKESVTAQELKLRHLWQLKGQVIKQRQSNQNICSELDSIRSVFNEKEKELSVALTKVDALTRQLEELSKGNTTNSYHINGISGNTAKHGIELEKLRQELLYRSKLSEQNGHDLKLKRGLITQRQSDLVRVDKRICELQQRLARKRQINQHLSSQMHTNLIRANHSDVALDENQMQINGVMRRSVGHRADGSKVNTMRPLSANINIAAVEPVLREQTHRINEFDSHLNANKDFMGCKQDQKYQTLPYNTKFGTKQQQQQQLQQLNYQYYDQSMHSNQLCVSTPDNDRIHCQLTSETNNSLNNDNNNSNSNHNNNVSIITNINNMSNNSNNGKVMTNSKNSVPEERPSPSGSSGSSDRASIPNHNAMTAYKLQQMHNTVNNSNNNNSNYNSAQHPYQNVNPKMFNGSNYVDPNGNSMNGPKQVKPNHMLSNSGNNMIANHKIQTNLMNTNQSVIQSQCVPTNNPNINQSQIVSNVSKVPPLTKPKPTVPPKPSVPVKPSPPPRQTPNHMFSDDLNEDLNDINAFAVNTRFSSNNNNNKKKSPNPMTNTSSTPINTSTPIYNRLPLTSLAIQKQYNAINSKSGLMNQQLPHHCQQQHQLIHHSYEDKSRNTSEPLHHLSNNAIEVTDGSQLNGPAMVKAVVANDITLSTSLLSSSLLSQNNVNNCDIKLMTNSKTKHNITDNCNSLQSKCDDRESTYGSIKTNGINSNKSNVQTLENISTINYNNNNVSNDWHKDKRRPVVANNEIEQQLALQVSVESKKSIETESSQHIQPNQSLLSQSQLNCDSKSLPHELSDCIKDNSSQSDANINKIQCDLTQTKSDKSVDKDNESDINLIKGQPLNGELKDSSIEKTTRQGFDSNLMIETNNKKDITNCDIQILQTSNLEPNVTVLPNHKSIVGSKRVKGNLKCQQQLNDSNEDHKNTSNGKHQIVSRRVSFDPLALLLDAALEGELELVKRTAKEVPNPSAANDEGITALHNAICAGHLDIVVYLVENGCDVNAQDSDGWTPLHCAASCNNLAMVKFLVEKGACIFATTLSDEETAAEKCEEDEEGYDGCSQYLYGIQEKLGQLNSSQVYAVYDYESQNTDELSFKEGCVMTVIRKGDEQEREWWWCRLNDREGYVPRNLLGLYPRVKSNKELQTIAEDNNE